MHERDEAHPPSYSIGTEGSFPGGKAVGGLKLTTYLHLVPGHGVVLS
jgi:hypothetical protein